MTPAQIVLSSLFTASVAAVGVSYACSSGFRAIDPVSAAELKHTLSWQSHARFVQVRSGWDDQWLVDAARASHALVRYGVDCTRLPSLETAELIARPGRRQVSDELFEAMAIQQGARAFTVRSRLHSLPFDVVLNANELQTSARTPSAVCSEPVLADAGPAGSLMRSLIDAPSSNLSALDMSFEAADAAIRGEGTFTLEAEEVWKNFDGAEPVVERQVRYYVQKSGGVPELRITLKQTRNGDSWTTTGASEVTESSSR